MPGPSPASRPSPATRALHAALQAGSPRQVSAALAGGPDMAWRQRGMSWVEQAIIADSIAQVDLPGILDGLLRAGATLDVSPPAIRAAHWSYLMVRSIKRRRDVISTLLYSRDDDHKSLAVLLDHGANPCVVHPPLLGSPYGPIDSAVILGSFHCAQMLLEHGASPDGGSGFLLCNVAFQSAHPACSRQMAGLLLAHGANAAATRATTPESTLIHPLINKCYGATMDLVLAGADLDHRLADTQAGFRTARTPRQMLAYLARNGDTPDLQGVRPSQVLAAVAAHHAAAGLDRRLPPAPAPSRPRRM